MIDFIKSIILSRSLVQSLLNNQKLEFIGNYNRTTGEVYGIVMSTYQDLTITILSTDRVHIAGSLHKCFNFCDKKKKGHNKGLFTYQNLLKVLNSIKQDLHINLSTAKLEHIEFGINLPCIDPSSIINSLVMHKRVSFKGFGQGKRFNGRRCDHQQYAFKCYEKHNDLRIECKIWKMEYLNDVKHSHNLSFKDNKILTLEDLKKKKILFFFKEKLLKNWNNLLIKEDISNIDRLTKKEILFITEFQNPLYWDNENMSPKIYHHNRKLYEGLLLNIRGFNIKTSISNLLDQKIDEMLNFQNPDFYCKVQGLFNRVISWLKHQFIPPGSCHFKSQVAQLAQKEFVKRE